MQTTVTIKLPAAQTKTLREQARSKNLTEAELARDLVAQGWTGREVRYALLTVNYRLPLNFTMAGLESARAALGRIDEWTQRLEESAGTAAEETDRGRHVEHFFAALDDDLNISGAMGHLFDLIRETNRALDSGQLSSGAAATVLGNWQRIDSVLSLHRDAISPPPDVLALVEERQAARAAKNWTESDRLRDEVTALGWVLKDTKDGAKLSPR